MFLSLLFPQEVSQHIIFHLDLVSAQRLNRVNKLGGILVNNLFSEHSTWKYKSVFMRLKQLWDEANWVLTNEEIEHFFKYNQIIEHIKEWGIEHHREQYGDYCRTTYFKELLIDFWALKQKTTLDNPMNLLDYSELLELVVVQHAAKLELTNPKYVQNQLLQNIQTTHEETWEVVSINILDKKQETAEKHYFIKMTYKAMTTAQCTRLIEVLNDVYQLQIASRIHKPHKIKTLFSIPTKTEESTPQSVFYLRADLFCSKMLGRLEPIESLVNFETLTLDAQTNLASRQHLLMSGLNQENTYS